MTQNTMSPMSTENPCQPHRSAPSPDIVANTSRFEYCESSRNFVS
jgi:hypothetical protein